MLCCDPYKLIVPNDAAGPLIMTAYYFQPLLSDWKLPAGSLNKSVFSTQNTALVEDYQRQ